MNTSFEEFEEAATITPAVLEDRPGVTPDTDDPRGR
jgi:hypothetical protein